MAGRPSQLDNEDFFLKIKEYILDGKSEDATAQILDIPINTWNHWKWRNYKGFNDRLLSYKHERMLQKAEANAEVLLDDEDKRLQADMTKFVLETLGKKNYSKKQLNDLTSDGQPITFTISQDIASKNGINTNTEDSSSG